MRRRLGGFTLIELMIAVAIVGILVRLAYPVYTQSVLRSHRTDAKSALLDLASREERYFSTANAYTDQAPTLGYASTATVTPAAPMQILSGSTAYYQMSVVFSAPSASNANWTFTATAAPIGNQTNDSCGSYTISNTGAQGISGGTGSATAASCW